MYTNPINIQSTIHSEPGATHLGGVLKLANRQTWAVTHFLAALQVTALLTQDCSQTHCTAQELLSPEEELCCWVLAGWKCRAPSEPWSCMSVLWSLLHLLSRLPHMRGTPGSPGLVPRIPLHHQSYWQCHNQSLLHKEVHHQTPGCWYCTFCRKTTRESGCHQRRGCSQGEEQATREMLILGAALALLIRDEVVLSKPMCVFVSISPMRVIKWRVVLTDLSGVKHYYSHHNYCYCLDRNRVLYIQAIPFLPWGIYKGYRSWNITEKKVFSFQKVAGLIIIPLAAVPHLV